MQAPAIRHRKSRGFYHLRPLANLMFAALAVQSCVPDGTIVDPASPDSQPVIGHFQGRTSLVFDSVYQAHPTRALEITNPKIALVWQFVGPREYTNVPLNARVDMTPPFNFSLDLRDPPPPEVLESPDLALGTFWLYSDINDNGRLDRLIDPNFLAANRQVDSLYAIYTGLADSLRVLSVYHANPVDVTETYDVGAFGSVARSLDGKSDTLWTSQRPDAGPYGLWWNVIYYRARLLEDLNRWESFFAVRKRNNDNYRIISPTAGFAFSCELPYRRRLFPKPGSKAEFEKILRMATGALLNFAGHYSAMTDAALSQGWADYPYTGHDAPGQDWVAGRTRLYQVIYIRDQSDFDAMMDGERFSSFRVIDKQKLHLGYNLITCGDQYSCRVLDGKDTIRIDLGASDNFFNPPGSPPAEVTEPTQARELAAGYLGGLEGAYRFQPFHPFCLKLEDGGLWAYIPDFGAYRMEAIDSLHFFTRARDLQLEIVLQSGAMEKIMASGSGTRFTAAKDTGQSIPDSISAYLQALASRRGVPADAAHIAVWNGAYAWGQDSITVSASPQGDSLSVAIPGMHAHAYLAASDSVFFSPQCDCRLTFRRNGAGEVTDAVFTREGQPALAPKLGFKPLGPAQLFPDLPAAPDSEAASSQGNTRDTYAGLDGRGHYPGSPDQRFVAAGDSAVESLDHSLPGDSISLSRGGEGVVFRLRGLKGAAAGLEALLREDVSGGKQRLRLRLLGGSDPKRMDTMLSGDFWADVTGDSAWVSLMPFPVAADPYFVRLERVRTAENLAPVAIDRFRILARKLP